MQIYTDAAQAALRQAKRISGQMKHPYTGTEHILLGLSRMSRTVQQDRCLQVQG